MEKKNAKSSRMIQSCDTIHIAWSQAYEILSKHEVFFPHKIQLWTSKFWRPRLL